MPDSDEVFAALCKQADHSRSSNAAAPYGPESFWGAFHHMMLDVGFVARGPERAAFWMAIWLAFFNQVCDAQIKQERQRHMR